MYSKEQTSQLKQEFWTTFGQYLAPQLSSEEQKTSWINYKTGFKHIYFKMDADKNSAYIGIEIAHPDTGTQELFFEQFKALKAFLHETLQEEWEWELHSTQENKLISRVIKKLDGVSILKKEDWPKLISFFKPRIILLDEFWAIAKDVFEPLK